MMIRTLFTATFLTAALLTAGAAHAGDDDLDRLRDAVARGEIMPLSTLQQTLRTAFPGEIISVKIDEDDDRFTYEFKVLQANGRVVEIEMDAATGTVLDVENDD